MVDELILHLGDRKTGSTSIQTALASQAASSVAGRIIYPTRWNHNALVNAIRGGAKPGILEEKANSIRQRLQKSDARYGIISAEQFEVAPPEAVQHFLHSYFPEWKGRVRLIAYIRPHADRLLSSFAERSKLGGGGKNIRALHENFKASGFLEYAPRLRAWRSVFGDNLTIRPFRRELLFEQDVVRDFFEFAFRGQEMSVRQVDVRNESVSLQDLAMLRWIHGTLRKEFGSRIKKTTQRSFGRRLAIVLASSRSQAGCKLQMDQQLVEDVIATYTEDAKSVDREWFNSEPMLEGLQAHRSKAIGQEQSLEASDYYDEETLRIMRCWTVFMGRMMAKDQKRFLALSLPPELRPKHAKN